jgi:hypothetical protein
VLPHIMSAISWLVNASVRAISRRQRDPGRGRQTRVVPAGDPAPGQPHAAHHPGGDPQRLPATSARPTPRAMRSAPRRPSPGQQAARPPELVVTCAFAACLERGFPLRFLAHVVAGRGAPVPRSWRASGPGFGGFRCAGQAGKGGVDVAEPAADPGRGQPARRGGPFPGQAQVLSQGPGEAELGIDGDDQSGPPVGCLRIAEFWGGPAED